MAKSLSTFLVPPNLAIAAGATTPDPGGTAARGVTVWSTTENALIRWSGSSWALVASGGGGGAATETTAGIAEIATQAETDAGIDDQRFVTPLKLSNWSGAGGGGGSGITLGLAVAMPYALR